jgi:uncharacterized protein with HEPN domain
MHSKHAHDLETDWELEHKVTRSIEIMGEAASRITDQMKTQFPELPWREMKGLRNRVIHQYFEINYQLIFDVVNMRLPVLKDRLEQVIKDINKIQNKKQLLSKRDKPVLLQKHRRKRNRGLGL